MGQQLRPVFTSPISLFREGATAPLGGSSGTAKLALERAPPRRSCDLPEAGSAPRRGTEPIVPTGGVGAAGESCAVRAEAQAQQRSGVWSPLYDRSAASNIATKPGPRCRLRCRYFNPATACATISSGFSATSILSARSSAPGSSSVASCESSSVAGMKACLRADNRSRSSSRVPHR